MRIISGGQTGVDVAALRVAKELGLDTGGWAPQGYLTQNGANFDLRDLYGLKEAPPTPDGKTYKARTYFNVRDSDATLRLAWNFSTFGEICTYNALLQYRRPKFDVNWVEVGIWEDAAQQPEDVGQSLNQQLAFDAHPQDVVDWIKMLMVKTLNVAGNSENTAPGIEKAAYNYLGALFTLLKESEGI